MRLAHAAALAACISFSGLTCAQSPALAGLLDFPSIYDEASSAELTVWDNPTSSASRIGTIDRHGIKLIKDADYHCKWQRDLDVDRQPMGCIFTESGYEVPALAIVGATTGGWYRIALDAEGKQSGWVKATDGYHSLADLLANTERLTYLAADWDGRLYRSATRSSEVTAKSANHARAPDSSAAAETPYRVRRSTVAGGELWLEVEVLDEVCGEHDPRVQHTGWVPVHAADGHLWAWFHSRGC